MKKTLIPATDSPLVRGLDYWPVDRTFGPFEPNGFPVQHPAAGRIQNGRRVHHPDKISSRGDEGLIKIAC